MGTTLVSERIEHGGTRIERFHEGVAVERERERERIFSDGKRWINRYYISVLSETYSRVKRLPPLASVFFWFQDRRE